MKNKYFFMVLLRYLYFPCIFIFRTTSHIYFLHFIIDHFWHFIKPKCRSIDILGTSLNQPDIFVGRLRTIQTNPTDPTFSLLYCEYISEPVPSDFHSNEDVE